MMYQLDPTSDLAQPNKENWNGRNCRLLWVMVMRQAMRDLVSDDQRDGQFVKREATMWLFNSTEAGPGSLPWVCEALDLDVSYVRRKSKELQNGGSIEKRIYTSGSRGRAGGHHVLRGVPLGGCHPSSRRRPCADAVPPLPGESVE